MPSRRSVVKAKLPWRRRREGEDACRQGHWNAPAAAQAVDGGQAGGEDDCQGVDRSRGATAVRRPRAASSAILRLERQSDEPCHSPAADAGLVACPCSLLGGRTEDGATSAPAAEPQPKASDEDSAQLKSLRAERIKVLAQLVEVLTGEYRVSTADFNQLFSAENELCNALLDSTDEPEKRVALLTKQVEQANDFLKTTQARFEAGTVSRSGYSSGPSRYVSVSKSSCCENVAGRARRQRPIVRESSHETPGRTIPVLAQLLR